MTNNYSRFDVWLRGFLYAYIAFVQYLVNDNTFRAWANPLTFTYLGASGAVALAIRAFFDLTAGRTKSDEPALKSEGSDEDTGDDRAAEIKALVQSAKRNAS